MKEEFLHYIWQYQQFDKSALKTTSNTEISILKQGILNRDSGPDFKEARVKIDHLEWIGSVEIHLKSSDWLRHNHQQDSAYDNVILHVVWQHDKEITGKDGKALPTLELAALTNQNIIDKYKSLVLSPATVPCSSDFHKVDDIIKMSMLDKALMQRLQRKAKVVLKRLASNLGDWEETVYQVLLGNFGFKLNNHAFVHLAENIPLKLLRKYSSSEIQTQALLYGVAGFLNAQDDEYALKLKKEYTFLRAKHGLEERELNISEWKFLRTRPANFPTVRLAEIAALISRQKSFFDVFTETADFKEIEAYFKSALSVYWREHYHFGKKSARPQNGLGKSSIHNLIINTVVPVLIANGSYTDEQSKTDRAISFLEAIPAERNRITRLWESLDLEIKTMSDSQGSIELYNEFCTKRQCLSCGVGVNLMKV